MNLNDEHAAETGTSICCWLSPLLLTALQGLRQALSLHSAASSPPNIGWFR
jgi:hypothetical protein